jgi:hypothetical protein
MEQTFFRETKIEGGSHVRSDQKTNLRTNAANEENAVNDALSASGERDIS